MVTRENTSLRDWLAKCPLIAILRGIETHEIDAIFSELLAAGIVIAEIPLNSPHRSRASSVPPSCFPARCWSVQEPSPK